MNSARVGENASWEYSHERKELLPEIINIEMDRPNLLNFCNPGQVDLMLQQISFILLAYVPTDDGKILEDQLVLVDKRTGLASAIRILLDSMQEVREKKIGSDYLVQNIPNEDIQRATMWLWSQKEPEPELGEKIDLTAGRGLTNHPPEMQGVLGMQATNRTNFPVVGPKGNTNLQVDADTAKYMDTATGHSVVLQTQFVKTGNPLGFLGSKIEHPVGGWGTSRKLPGAIRKRDPNKLMIPKSVLETLPTPT